MPAKSHGHWCNRKCSSEYSSYRAMRSRCENPNTRGFNRYAGRGIKVCDRWHSFENFLADMGPKPPGRYTLERKDNDGDYTPENCIWATNTEQSNNRRSNVVLSYNGQTMNLMQWSQQIGIDYFCLNKRVKKLKWDAERALTTPYIPMKPRVTSQ